MAIFSSVICKLAFFLSSPTDRNFEGGPAQWWMTSITCRPYGARSVGYCTTMSCGKACSNRGRAWKTALKWKVGQVGIDPWCWTMQMTKDSLKENRQGADSQLSLNTYNWKIYTVAHKTQKEKTREECDTHHTTLAWTNWRQDPKPGKVLLLKPSSIAEALLQQLYGILMAHFCGWQAHNG